MLSPFTAAVFGLGVLTGVLSAAAVVLLIIWSEDADLDRSNPQASHREHKLG